MTHVEIEELLSDAEKSIRLELMATPLAGWVLSLGSLGSTLFYPAIFGLFFGLPLAALSLSISADHRIRWRQVQARRAAALWEHLSKTVFDRLHNPVTASLAKAVAWHYQSDPRGEILPLSQALRLVETHHKQQQRLDVVNARLQVLHSIGVQLREKTERLRALGEGHRDAEARLQSMQDDESALGTMRDQIIASCHRLEMIVLEAQKSQQMRQLYREISALTYEETLTHTSQSVAESVAESHTSLLDIEAQITREVETFLRLERDTDAHLR